MPTSTQAASAATPTTVRIRAAAQKWRWRLLTAAILLIGLYGFLIEPNRLKISHLHLESSATLSGLRGKTAIHLSDLHIATIGRREEHLLRTIEELDPDLIFLTGDYVTFRGNYDVAIDFLARLHARNGVWAVMGDYDYSNSRKSCLFCHKAGTADPTHRHSVRFLDDTTTALDLGMGEVILGGAVPRSMVDPETSLPDIVLSHNPLMFDHYSEKRDVLMLAGDTHGGQVPAPSWFWHLIGYHKNARYSHGYFEDQKKKMYVNRGFGTSHLPFRIGRSPELVVLHF